MGMVQRMIRSEHVRHGVKVGLASVLAYLLADWVGLPYGYWAVITTVIVMQMHVADSIRMCLYRFSGTAIGAAMGIAMILAFPPTHWYTLVGIFCGTAVCAYLTRYDARFRMAAITVSIVYLTSLGTDSRIPFGLFRVAEIGVGVLCAFIVSVLVWPNRAGSTLRARLKVQFEDAADRYALLMDKFLSLQQKADPDLFFDLDADIHKNMEMFHSVYAMERIFFRDDVALLSMQVAVIRSVLERLQAMLTLLNEVEGDGFEIIMAPELNELVRATSEALRAVGAGRPHDPRALAAAVVAIEARFQELRLQGVTLRFDVRRLLQVLGVVNTVQHLGEYMLEILNRPEMEARE